MSLAPAPSFSPWPLLPPLAPLPFIGAAPPLPNPFTSSSPLLLLSPPLPPLSCPLSQVRPELLGAAFEAYRAARLLPFAMEQQQQLSLSGTLPDAAHELRQLLLLLASVGGALFTGPTGAEGRAAYAHFMLSGALGLLQVLGPPFTLLCPPPSRPS